MASVARSTLVALALCLLRPAESLHFLGYNPMWGRSHIRFLGSLAEVLAEAGHEVTMLVPEIEAHLNYYGTDHPGVRIIRVPQCAAAKEFYSGAQDEFVSNVWKSRGGTEIFTHIFNVAEMFIAQCNATLRHPGLFEELRSLTFDAAYAEPMDVCAFAIFRELGITRFSMALSASGFDGSFEWTGMPAFPSYVPGTMVPFTDKMTFFQRIGNLVALNINKYFFPYVSRNYAPLFDEHFGYVYPDWSELISEASLFFVNADPLVEYPTVRVHKVIDIGGVSVAAGHKPLNETWSAIMNLRPRTVLLSFGSVAKSSLMPPRYKQSIVETIKNFPDVTFIWKYEKPSDLISAGVDNIVEATWVPQNDMLYDPRLSLFITHCGQGSTTEATTAGVPVVVIPVLGDQIRNAQNFKRTGTGIVLYKRDLESSDKLEEALRTILETDPIYTEKAKELGRMIRDKAFSPRDLFVKNMEFMAKYGPLRMLDHYGRQLNFFQFYLIDVFAFLALITMVVLAIVFILLRTIFRFIRHLCFAGKWKTE